MKYKRVFAYIFCYLFFVSSIIVYAQTLDASSDILKQGINAYKAGDWNSASLFLRKVVSYPKYSTDETWYLLIMSEMFGENYKGVIDDSTTFFEKFSSSMLIEYVQYQRGRALHFIGDNDGAVKVLGDFCRKYPYSPLYGSAIFWIGECFFVDYDYETAKSLYEVVVSDYSDEPCVQDAHYRLDTIAQSEREEKLLYLLKMTGEEYLSTREKYERQLLLYKSEDIESLRTQLKNAKERIKELEEAPVVQSTTSAPKADESIRSTSYIDDFSDSEEQIDSSDDEVEALKLKADILQHIIDEKSGGK